MSRDAESLKRLHNEVTMDRAKRGGHDDYVDAVRYINTPALSISEAIKAATCSITSKCTTAKLDTPKNKLEEMRKTKPKIIPKRVIYNGPCTIVIWNDDSKTIVRLGEGQAFDKYTGFIAALAKKMYGSTSFVKKMLEEISVCEPIRKEEKNSNE